MYIIKAHDTWPHDHNLRNYLSLKLDCKFVEFFFYDTLFLIICRYKQYVHLNRLMKFLLINKTNAEKESSLKF